MPVTHTLGRQRQVDLGEFKANLVYKESSRTVRAVTQRNSVSKTITKNPKQKNKGKVLYIYIKERCCIYNPSY